MNEVNREKGILIVNIPTVLANALNTLGLTSSYDKSFFMFQLLRNIPDKEVGFDDIVCKAIDSLGVTIEDSDRLLLCYRIADSVWKNIIVKFKQLTHYIKNPLITTVEVDGRVAKIGYVWEDYS